MHALPGAFASGLLPWPQTLRRLGLLLAVSVALHALALGALPGLMSGVAPETAAVQSKILRATLRPAPSLPAPPAAAFAPAPLVPAATPPASSGPATPGEPASGPQAPRALPKPPAPVPPTRTGSELAPAHASGPLSGPRYFSLSELERRPAPITRIEPVYPPEAGTAEGKVVITLLINENGGIDKVSIVSAEPPGVFERAATEAFVNARYQPALKWNQRVKSQITFEVRFLREDAPPSPDKLPPMVPTGPPKPAS